MLYSVMIDGTTPNLIAFYLATVKHMGGTDAQLQAAWTAHEHYQTPLDVDIETDDPTPWGFGRADLVDVFRTYYGRRLIAPGMSLQDNLVNTLLCNGTSSPPLWTGLFGLYGLPLVHLSDALEVQTAVYAKQALALAASNLDSGLSCLFSEIVGESSRRREAMAAAISSSLAPHSLHRSPPLPFCVPPSPQNAAGERRSPLDILESLAFDGRLSNLPLDLPGYFDHGLYGGRHWSSLPEIRDAVLACTWQWGALDTVQSDSVPGALDALEELGRTAVVLACGTHKPGDVEFDFYLCFLVTLVYSLRTVLVSLQCYGAVQVHAADLVRCLWAMFVLVYILQLRPKMDVALLGTPRPRHEPTSNQFREFRADLGLALPKHQDPFYLRTLRSMAGLAACERDRGWQILINNAASKFRQGWRRWIGFQPSEGVSMNVRI
ncbi:hypothetical protein F503_03836 [Ophiostoma piceae UAMH 11346]|uniref:Uncharacterized protein n=1 Tax=Ophiostoma piceae (strain UAMH 11346) TaxID=1262450 RepID=S3C0M9_OPHP1|nr:hypothetical protein F503_03836 [Ophiostoma piceae UAMH 11346]